MAGTHGTSWVHHPPYAPPPADFQTKLQGHCHCGQVTYNLSRDTPLASKYCHCSDCKTLHGAPFQWAAIVHKTDIAFSEKLDPSNLSFYKTTTGETDDQGNRPELPLKVRCSRCGSLLFDEGRNMVLLFPTALKFPDQQAAKKFDVQDHIFYGDRIEDIPDGKPKWKGLDGKSERMDEH